MWSPIQRVTDLVSGRLNWMVGAPQLVIYHGCNGTIHMGREGGQGKWNRRTGAEGKGLGCPGQQKWLSLE